MLMVRREYPTMEEIKTLSMIINLFISFLSRFFRVHKTKTMM